MGIPMPVESVVHEVDLSDEWAALSQQLETAMQEETATAVQETAQAQHDAQVPTPVLIPAEAAQSQAEEAAEAPAFDLELQSVAPVEVAESETLAADSLIADLAGELDSITSSLGIPAGPSRRPGASFRCATRSCETPAAAKPPAAVNPPAA